MLAFLFASVICEDACDMCHTTMPLLIDAVHDGISDKDIKDGLEKACPSMPSQYIPYCYDALSKIDAILADVHAGKDANYLCKTYGYCASSNSKVAVRNVDNGVVCDTCVKVVSYIETILKDTTVESEVAALVAKYCEKLPTPVSTICVGVVDKYIPEIMKWLEQGLEHLEICQKIGFCATKSRHVDNGVVCDMCTQVIAYVELVLKDTTVESEVAALVSKFCEKFPVPVSTICVGLVDKYVPIIMQWIEQGLEHEEICQKIGFCSSKIDARNNNGIVCDMCTQVIAYIELVLKDTTVESEIAALVAQFCNKFPVPVSTICTGLVDKYIPAIIQWLEQGLEHSEICTKIGFCTATQARQVDNGVVCDMCIKVVAYIEELLKDKTVESEIATLVATFCTNIPFPVSTLCAGIVEKYIPAIILWLEQGLEHIEICNKIGFCQNQLARIPAIEANGISCDVCKEFFKWADKEIEKYTVPFLWKLVNEKCPSVPYLRQICKIINEQNIEQFLNLILQQIPPEKACTFIKLC